MSDPSNTANAHVLADRIAAEQPEALNVARSEIATMAMGLDGLRANLEAQLAFLRRDVIAALNLSSPLALAS